MTCKITAALSAVTLLLSVSFPAGASAASGGQQFGVYANGYPSAAEVDTMARGGVRWLRVVFPFVQIGAQPEKWDWSGTDAIVAEATSAGIRVLPVLFTVPSWLASKENRAPVHNRRARRAWSNFAAASARRYGHNGTFWKGHPTIAYRPITTWQAWNEPNLPFFWGGSPNVGRYVQLLRITRRSLRRSDPRARVATAGLFRYHTRQKSLSMADFMRRFYRFRGVRGYFDIMSIHPYSPRPRGVWATVRKARRIMRQAGDGGTPIWVTEFGWSTGGSGWERATFRATPRQQARWLRQTYRFFQRRPRPGVAFWHSWRDFGDIWYRQMGLFRLDGTPKPAWRAYARAAGGNP